MESTAAVQYFLPFTIAMIMLAMGLGLRVDDFRRIGVDPRGVAVGAIGQLILLPVLGAMIAWVFGLAPELAVGVVILTACPGQAHSNLFSNLARGDTALSVTLTALTGVVTIVTLPLVVFLGVRLFGLDGEVHLPIGRTIVELIVTLGIPLVVGVAARSIWPTASKRLEPIIKGFAVALLLLIVAGSVARQSSQVLAFSRQVGAAVLVLNVSGLIIGASLASIAGLSPRQVVTVAIEVGVQNSALAVMIAMTFLGSTVIAVPAIVYSLLVYVTSTAVVLVARRRLPPLAQ